MVSGFVTLLIWEPLGLDGVVHEVFPAMAISILAYLAVSRLGGGAPDPKVALLFDGERKAVPTTVTV